MQENKLKLLSRLTHKNLVYKLTLSDKAYCIKIYYKGNDISQRYLTERKMYEYFSKTNLINVPNFIFSSEVENVKYLVTDFVNLKSLKNVGDDIFLMNLEAIFNQLKKIWSIEDIELPVENIGIDHRLNIKLNTLFNSIKNLNLSIDLDKLFEIYYSLLSEYSTFIPKVINSDISAHEILLGDNNIYFIDFEGFKIGDINNDLARSFYSFSSNRSCNIKEKLFNYISDFDFYNENNFLYYLVEKFLCNIYATNGKNLQDEIYFYNFIIEKYNKRILVKN